METMTSQYQVGFGNHFESEALPNTLPQGQNAPQKVNHGLYAEQLSGTAFTMSRDQNKRSWLYKIHPSVKQGSFEPLKTQQIKSTPFDETPPNPNRLRWSPLTIPTEKTDFIDGLTTIAGGGDSSQWSGLGVHIYVGNTNMKNRYFYNADGEMLFVPQEGKLRLRTEMGVIALVPGEIAVIPRGIKFAVDFPDDASRGYVCENYGSPFIIPDLGPIGANGLANPRDFKTPVAAFEDKTERCELVAKFGGALWRTVLDHSPLDVVAWHGNYAPYKYDLALFNVMNTVSFDHADPSIFTVLTSPSTLAGTANVDFVIFPPRWSVAENTFRPPYFHRNIMSEFMGLIYGVYDAKEAGSDKNGFMPGGYSLHNCMSAHGPDTASFEKASNETLKPVYMKDTLAFMFESRFIMNPTKQAMKSKTLQKDYDGCWADLPRSFKK